jgi:hypothetical protein
MMQAPVVFHKERELFNGAWLDIKQSNAIPTH